MNHVIWYILTIYCFMDSILVDLTMLDYVIDLLLLINKVKLSIEVWFGSVF
jgi:hypothetical protein